MRTIVQMALMDENSTCIVSNRELGIVESSKGLMIPHIGDVRQVDRRLLRAEYLNNDERIFRGCTAHNEQGCHGPPADLWH